MHRLARVRDSPRPWNGYALGLRGTTMVRSDVEDKLDFEGLRTDLRALVGFPVTQPGAFGALVRFAANRREEFLVEASRDLAQDH